MGKGWECAKLKVMHDSESLLVRVVLGSVLKRSSTHLSMSESL